MGVNERLVLPNIRIFRKILKYDPLTGDLFKNGKLVGASTKKKGLRIIILINNVKYNGPRIIWKLVTGKDPGWKEIDHIDGDATNDRWSNLRLATRRINNLNMRRRKNKWGYPGVRQNHKRWVAEAKSLTGERVRLGNFDTPEEASYAHDQYMLTHRKGFHRNDAIFKGSV